jgi:CheY-like chemotaxis protein
MNKDHTKILLADDDEDDRMIFTDAFKEVKIKTKVDVVKDGLELMDFLKKPENDLPDVLFLDLNMPCKSGIECLAEIKSDERLKDMAIVIYSTSASEKDIEETFVKGANVYMQKPSDFGVLKKLLSEVIIINWQYQTSGLNRDNFLLSL